jgi:hypothetical protein
MPEPTNKKLYAQVKREAKARFKAWPSAYASGWLVQEYKRRGGKYKGPKPRQTDLDRWFRERWVNVCQRDAKGAYKPCGRPKGGYKNYKRKYPYCRPSVRVSAKTPKTVGELSRKELQARCKRKRSRTRVA